MSIHCHRLLLAALPATLISLSLFLVMQRLIAGPPAIGAASATTSRIVFAPVLLPEPDLPPPVAAPVEPPLPPPRPTAEPIDRPFDRPRPRLEPLGRDGEGVAAGIGDVLERVSVGAPTGPSGTLRHGIQPIYPRSALIRGLEGQVVVALEVDENGRVRRARVVSSDPPRVFDQAALKAALRWQFWPGAATVVHQEIVFSLDPERG